MNHFHPIQLMGDQFAGETSYQKRSTRTSDTLKNTDAVAYTFLPFPNEASASTRYLPAGIRGSTGK